MYLVIAYSQAARARMRNAVASHGESVVRRFGRVVLFERSAWSRFLVCRFRAEFGDAVQVEQVEPFVAAEVVEAVVREAAQAYADRVSKSTSYAKFAVGTRFPGPSELKDGGG